MIEQERGGIRGNPERDINAWLEKLAEVEQERRGYLRLAAKDRMTDAELDQALGELEETREAAEREIGALRGRKESLEALERDRDALLDYYAQMVPEALDALTPEERQQVYAMLRLEVEVDANGQMEARGVLSAFVMGPGEEEPEFCESGVTSGRNIQTTKSPELRFRAVLGDGARELRFERLITR
jgi:hypothetical protein